MDRYKLILVATFEGEYTRNPDDIIVNLLKWGRIDQDGFDGKYDSMGVGCSCNSEKGMECAVIFGQRVLIKGSSIFKDYHSEVLDKDECRA